MWYEVSLDLQDQWLRQMIMDVLRLKGHLTSKEQDSTIEGSILYLMNSVSPETDAAASC